MLSRIVSYALVGTLQRPLKIRWRGSTIVGRQRKTRFVMLPLGILILELGSTHLSSSSRHGSRRPAKRTRPSVPLSFFPLPFARNGSRISLHLSPESTNCTPASSRRRSGTVSLLTIEESRGESLGTGNRKSHFRGPYPGSGFCRFRLCYGYGCPMLTTHSRYPDGPFVAQSASTCALPNETFCGLYSGAYRNETPDTSILRWRSLSCTCPFRPSESGTRKLGGSSVRPPVGGHTNR